ncbi:hypothetical protein ACF0H5_007831 [Mactra antiquata]
MSTLSSVLKNKSPGPYQKGIKVTVVAASVELKYKARDGKEKSLISVAISDGEEVIKYVVYDPSQGSRKGPSKPQKRQRVDPIISEIDYDKLVAAMIRQQKDTIEPESVIDEIESAELEVLDAAHIDVNNNNPSTSRQVSMEETSTQHSAPNFMDSSRTLFLRDALAIERENLAAERENLAAERDNLTAERAAIAIERDSLKREIREELRRV